MGWSPPRKLPGQFAGTPPTVGGHLGSKWLSTCAAPYLSRQEDKVSFACEFSFEEIDLAFLKDSGTTCRLLKQVRWGTRRRAGSSRVVQCSRVEYPDEQFFLRVRVEGIGDLNFEQKQRLPLYFVTGQKETVNNLCFA